MYIIWCPKQRRTRYNNYKVFRIWYDNEVVYVGYTSQALATVLRRHFLKPNKQFMPIDIRKVTQIDMQIHKSRADAMLYAVYYRNKWKPRLNGGYWESDRLSINLPKVRWRVYRSRLMDQWREQDALIRAGKKKELDKKRVQWRMERQRQQKLKVPTININRDG